jgi:hypothetical protein
MSTLASRLYSWTNDKNSGVPITASRQDAEDDNFITKLNQKVLIKSSAPDSPIAGMLWYDSTNKFLKQFRNSEWVVLGVHVGASAPSTIQEGDVWWDTANNLLKAYNGSAWESVITSAGGTFTAFPVTPSAAPDADYEVANKKYVEDFTPATPTADKGLRLDGDGKIPAVDGSQITGQFFPTQVNDTDAGTSLNTGGVAFLSVAKTCTSGKTIMLVASGYCSSTSTNDFPFTFYLKHGSTTVQTVILSTLETSKAKSWACCGIVTGLSGSVTFTVVGKSNDTVGTPTAYGNLVVLEF